MPAEDSQVKNISRHDARKKLVKSTDGLYHIPLLCGIKDNDELVFTNRKKVMKFFGPYALRELQGKIVYELDREREEMLRRRDLKTRQDKVLRQTSNHEINLW